MWLRCNLAINGGFDCQTIQCTVTYYAVHDTIMQYDYSPPEYKSLKHSLLLPNHSYCSNCSQNRVNCDCFLNPTLNRRKLHSGFTRFDKNPKFTFQCELSGSRCVLFIQIDAYCSSALSLQPLAQTYQKQLNSSTVEDCEQQNRRTTEQ